MPRLILSILILTLLVACSGPTAAPSAAPPVVPTPTATRVRLARASPEPPTAQAQPTPEGTRLPHLEEPLVWMLRAAPQPDLALVNDELNRRLAGTGFNARVELRLVDALHYDRAVAELVEKGELPDLLTTGGAAYENGVLTGLYLPIREEDAPGLWQSLPPPAWQAVRRQGQVYGVPGVGRWTRPAGVAVRADVLLGMSLDPRLTEVNSFSELTKLLEDIQAAINRRSLDLSLRTALGTVDLLRPEAAGYEPLAAHFAVRVDAASGPSGEIVNWLQTPAVLELANLRREWALSGLEPGRIYDPAGWQELCEAGRFAAVVGILGNPHRCGMEWVEKPLAPIFLSTDAISATLTAVGTKDPERALRALRLLELLRADPALYNLLSLGIEGRHWVWNAARDGVILLPEDPASAAYRPAIDEQLGRPDLRYTTSPEEALAWQTVLDWNERAIASPALGFRLDPGPVAGPLAAMRGLERELSGSLANGRVENVESGLQRLDEQMEALGAGAVSAELARQLLIWRTFQP